MQVRVSVRLSHILSLSLSLSLSYSFLLQGTTYRRSELKAVIELHKEEIRTSLEEGGVGNEGHGAGEGLLQDEVRVTHYSLYY